MNNNIYSASVQPEDIDLTGLVTIPALYRKIISAVSLNIRKEGYGVDEMARRGLTWALARCAVVIFRRPELYSELSTRVWKGRDDTLCYDRTVEIRDSSTQVIGCGITDWCVLDRNTHRPAASRLESRLEARDVGCTKPLRLAPFDGGSVVSGIAGYSECDFNGHLNNCRYVDRFFDLLPDDVTSTSRPQRLDINFKSEILRGARITAAIRQSSESRIDFCLRSGASVACLASLAFI